MLPPHEHVHHYHCPLIPAELLLLVFVERLQNFGFKEGLFLVVLLAFDDFDSYFLAFLVATAQDLAKGPFS